MADRFQVVVHVPAGTLCGTNSDPASGTASDIGMEPAVVENGPPLHPETVRRLTCDGALISMLENEKGEVLNVGRKTRVIPSAIRRALRARDNHCQFPGCGHRKNLDGHHIIHWAHGGQTRLDNLIPLCRRHHRSVHELGYSVQKSSTGFRFSKRKE